MNQPVFSDLDDPLDRDYLERNYLALGCADVLADVAAMYLESAPEKLSGMHEALNTANLEQLGRLAHGLKGESGSVGARQMTALAAFLEQSARQGDLDACRHCIKDLAPALDRVSSLLKQEYGA